MNPRTPKKFRPRARLMVTAVASCFAVGAYGFGTNPTFVAGSGAVNQVGNTMTVTNSNGAIINWNTLSVWQNETLNFNQAAGSSVLNRVIGTMVNGKLVVDPTQILGSVTSKGNVWIINPSGIMVGAGAKIDVAQFVASTLNVSDANFLAGKLLFDATPGAGSVVNQGTITTPSGGSVYLIAPQVKNEGIITTPNGEAILAAGQTVQLVDTGTPGVKVEITGSEGTATNLGTVLAEAGRIGMAGVLVKNSGTLNASSVVNEGGRIFLKASQDAYVDGDGRIVTTGTKGGKVEVLGNRVAVMDNAAIDASGTNGGGTVLVGGDYQGKNAAIQNASITYFGPNASIKADAADNGDGGKVILWADDTTRAYGRISARGGVVGGNGGFVETSGHRYLDILGVQVVAGEGGKWLLDPADITITAATGGTAQTGSPFSYAPAGASGSISDSTIAATLNAGTDVVIETSSGSGGNGDITVSAGVTIANTSGGARYLTLNADRHISITGAAILGTSGNSLGVNLNAGKTNANGSISISNAIIETYGGTMSLLAAKDITLTGLSSPAYSGLIYGGTVLSTAGCFVAGSPSSCTPYSASVNGSGAQTVKAGYDWTNSTQLTGVGELKLQGASSGTYGGVLVVSGGGQTIAANRMEMYGGSSGQNNGVIVANYSTSSQNVTVNRLLLKAGGSGTTDFNDGASLYSSYGSQFVNITGSNGSVTLYGGSGGSAAAAYGGLSGAHYDSGCATYGGGANYCYRSDNAAEIIHRSDSVAYTQSVTFDDIGGSIALYGGSSGAGNSARIGNESADGASSPGTQQIGNGSYRPDIYLRGGSSGGKLIHGSDGEWYDIRNAASIESDSSAMTVYAGNISLSTGGGVSAAFIGGGPHGGGGIINVKASGNVTLTGGSSGTATAFNDSSYSTNFTSPVAIGNDKSVTVNLTADGDVSLSSGSNVGGWALIGSLNSSAVVNAEIGGDLTLTSTGAGVGIGSHADDPTKGYYGGAGINIDVGGGVMLTASSSTSFGTFIGALDDRAGPSTIYVNAGDDVVLNGGGGLGALIGVKSPTQSGNFVSVTAGKAYIGNAYVGTAGDVWMLNNAHIKAGSGSYAGTVEINAFSNARGSMGKAILDTVTAGDQSHGLVTIYASNAVLDNNGSAVNVYGSNVNLSSYYGGQSGGLAISLDTRASGSISATTATCVSCVAPPPGGYGGISVRNYSSTAPTSVTLRDNSTYAGNISFYNDASLATGILNISSASGDIAIASGNNLTVSGGTMSVTSDHSLLLTAGNELDFLTTTQFSTPGSLGLAAPTINVYGGGSYTAIDAGGDVVIAGRQVSVGHNDHTGITGNNISVYATNLTMDTGGFFASGDLNIGSSAAPVASFSATNVSLLEADGDINVFAGSVAASNNTWFSAGPTDVDSNVRITASGNITLANGAKIRAGNDVYLTLTGVSSTLSLSGNSQVVSDLATLLPATTHITFKSRSSGGVMVDGVAGTAVGTYGSGFYAAGPYAIAPVTKGAGLDLSYGASEKESVDVTNEITKVLTDTTKETKLTDDTTKTTPSTLVLKPVGQVATATTTQTVGGDSEDSFGGSEKKTDTQKDSTNTSDTKDKNNGKSTAKNQCS